MLPDYKLVKKFAPFCPVCKKELLGDGSAINSYSCDCGIWIINFDTKEFDIEKSIQQNLL